MAVVRRKIARSSRKTTAKKLPVGSRRKTVSRVPAPVREDRVLQTLQQALFKSLAHAEGRDVRRSELRLYSCNRFCN